MIHLISSDDFVNELLIPGVVNPNSGDCELLCYIIDKYEPLYLTNVLGYEFYKTMMDTISADPDNVPQEYIDLIDGADYVPIYPYNSCDTLRHWEGLRQYCAQYCYYWFYRNEATQTANMGEFIPTSSAGAIVSHGRKMMDAYNRSMRGVQLCREYMRSVEWTIIQPCMYCSWWNSWENTPFFYSINQPNYFFGNYGPDYMNQFGI
jgi:hypothetical protein